MLSEVRLISFFIVLVLAAVSDIRKREIPDGIPLLVTIVSLIPLESVQLSGLLVALPLLMIGVTAGGIGGGDIKLTGACGLVLGFGRALIGLITGLLLLLVFHAARQCVKRIKKENRERGKEQAYPLVPFLLLGMLISIQIGG